MLFFGSAGRLFSNIAQYSIREKPVVLVFSSSAYTKKPSGASILILCSPEQPEHFCHHFCWFADVRRSSRKRPFIISYLREDVKEINALSQHRDLRTFTARHSTPFPDAAKRLPSPDPAKKAAASGPCRKAAFPGRIRVGSLCVRTFMQYSFAVFSGCVCKAGDITAGDRQGPGRM